MSKTCPSCNKTFDDSITTCPNCQIALVPVKQESSNRGTEIKQVSVFSLTSEDSAQRVIEYMKEQGVEGEYRYNLREKTFKIFVAESDARNALRACTSFYAVEAKRLKAKEDKIREEEEAKRRAEEEEKRRIEEEERRKREEEEARKRAEEEAERLRREAIEAEKRAEEEAAVRKAEEEARNKAEEAERIRLEAEEAVRKAEQTARLIEEEAKRAAEEEERLKLEAEENEKRRAMEEKERQALEEQRLIEEEKEKKRAESERRRSIFVRGIREAEAERLEKQKKKFSNIPHVEGETVEEETPSSPEDSYVPENGPIFVETEPVAEYEVGDTITVDAVEIEVSEAYDNVETIYDQSTEQESDFPDFFAGIGKNKSKSNSSIFESSDNDNDTPLFGNTSGKSQTPFVEDMFTNNVFSTSDKTITAENIYMEKQHYEEVINDDLKSDDIISDTNGKIQSRFAAKFANLDSVDDGTYKGFVPDFHAESDEEDEDTKIAKSYGFNPEEYRKLKESTAKKAQDRKNNPQPRKRPENKDFIMMEEVPADDYKGFVPDYSQRKNQEKMDYYTNRTTIDYSKYRTQPAGNERNTLAELNSTLRSTSHTELSRLFENDVIKTASKPQDFIALKSSNYLLALTGGQLNSLFTSWLMTNCTSATVKQYVKDSATPDENYNNKIEGIKNLLKQNFGKLDDAALDIIVKKFYNKYLDE